MIARIRERLCPKETLSLEGKTIIERIREFLRPPTYPEIPPELEARITTLEEWKAEVAPKITTLESWKATYDAWKTTTESRLSTIEGKFPTIDTKISDLVATVSALDTRIADLEAGITEGIPSAEIEAIKADILDLQTKISTLTTDLNTAIGRITGVETTVAAHERRIAALETWKVEIETWRTNINTWKSNMDTYTSGLNTWKTSTNSRLDALETDVGGIKTWKTTISATVDFVKGSWDAFKPSFDTWKAKVDSDIASLWSAVGAPAGVTTLEGLDTWAVGQGYISFSDWVSKTNTKATAMKSILDVFGTSAEAVTLWKGGIDATVNWVETIGKPMKSTVDGLSSSVGILTTYYNDLLTWKGTMDTWKTRFDTAFGLYDAITGKYAWQKTIEDKFGTYYTRTEADTIFLKVANFETELKKYIDSTAIANLKSWKEGLDTWAVGKGFTNFDAYVKDVHTRIGNIEVYKSALADLSSAIANVSPMATSLASWVTKVKDWKTSYDAWQLDANAQIEKARTFFNDAEATWPTIIPTKLSKILAGLGVIDLATELNKLLSPYTYTDIKTMLSWKSALDEWAKTSFPAENASSSAWGFKDESPILGPYARRSINIEITVYNATTTTESWTVRCTVSSSFAGGTPAKFEVIGSKSGTIGTFTGSTTNGGLSSWFTAPAGQLSVRVRNPDFVVGEEYNYTIGDAFTFSTTKAILVPSDLKGGLDNILTKLGYTKSEVDTILTSYLKITDFETKFKALGYTQSQIDTMLTSYAKIIDLASYLKTTDLEAEVEKVTRQLFMYGNATDGWYFNYYDLSTKSWQSTTRRKAYSLLYNDLYALGTASPPKINKSQYMHGLALIGFPGTFLAKVTEIAPKSWMDALNTWASTWGNTYYKKPEWTFADAMSVTASNAFWGYTLGYKVFNRGNSKVDRIQIQSGVYTQSAVWPKIFAVYRTDQRISTTATYRDFYLAGTDGSNSKDAAGVPTGPAALLTLDEVKTWATAALARVEINSDQKAWVDWWVANVAWGMEQIPFAYTATVAKEYTDKVKTAMSSVYTAADSFRGWAEGLLVSPNALIASENSLVYIDGDHRWPRTTVYAGTIYSGRQATYLITSMPMNLAIAMCCFQGAYDAASVSHSAGWWSWQSGVMMVKLLRRGVEEARELSELQIARLKDLTTSMKTALSAIKS